VQIDELAEDGNLKQGGISNSTMLLANFLKDEEVQKQFLGLKVGDITKLNPLKATGSEAETASMLGIEKDKVTVLTSDFQFEITKIERNVPAELGEELYKLVYPKEEIKTEEEFRAKVKEEISKAYEIETERLFSRYAMDRLFDDTEINLPEEFLKKWLYASNEGKVTTEEIEKSYHGYSKAMKMELIENTLIKANSSLKVTDEDLKAEIKNYFRGYLMPDQAAQQEEDPGMAEQLDLIADNYLKKNKKESQRIHDEIFSHRLAGFLKNEMKRNNKEVLYDEFVEVVSKVNAQSHDHDHDHDNEVHSEHE